MKKLGLLVLVETFCDCSKYHNSDVTFTMNNKVFTLNTDVFELCEYFGEQIEHVLNEQQIIIDQQYNKVENMFIQWYILLCIEYKLNTYNFSENITHIKNEMIQKCFN